MDSDPQADDLAPRDELARIDTDLLAARQRLDDLRDERTDELPDTADDAGRIREFEDQERIIQTLEERRATVEAELD